MSIAKISAAVSIGMLSLSALAMPAIAASLATKAFLDNVTPNVDYLDRSSRIVLTNSKDAKLRDFARAEATDSTNTANAIYDWSLAGGKAVVASNNSEAPLQTGRSVAVDSAAVDTRLPRGQEDIDALYGAEGKDLDDSYKQAQIDALSQLQSDYRDYIATGDDASLKALAARGLPLVTKRLALLNKM